MLLLLAAAAAEAAGPDNAAGSGPHWGQEGGCRV